MDTIEIVSLVVAFLGVGSFAAVFTILYVTYSKSIIKEFQSGKKDIEIVDEAIYDNLSNVKKRRKIIKTIKSIGFYGLMIIIIPFFVLSLINKFNGSVTMIGDKGIIVVATGSMSKKNEENDYIITYNLENQFDAYSLIVIEKIESESELRIYDVISYINDEGTNVIHRIIGTELGIDGKVHYLTRGDSNNATDDYKPVFEDIQGRYTGQKLPVVGMFVLFMQSSIGIITVVALVYCLIMIDRFTEKILRAQQNRLDRLSSAIDFEHETELGTMSASYFETIYYKGFSYKFDDDGFVEKNEIIDKDLLEKSNSSVIKIIENKETNEVISKEITVDDEKSGKEGE